MDTMAKTVQEVHIRGMPRPIMQRFRAALAAQGYTLSEWFYFMAKRTAEAYEKRLKGGGRNA